MSCVAKRVQEMTDEMLEEDLDYLINYSKRERRIMHEVEEGYAPIFHHIGIGNIPSRTLISKCRDVISLFHWEFLTHEDGSQYATGYLPNGRRWITSRIKKVRFCYNEYISNYIEISTQNSKYKLPANSSVFSIQWLNFGSRFTRERSLHCDMGNVIDIEDWEISDRNWRGGRYHTYYLNGVSSGGYTIKSSKITNILYYNGELNNEPLIYFVTNGGFMYRARYDESCYYGEYLEL